MTGPLSFGLLNINKPPGMTSRRVVDHVARLVKPAKAGHAGTLDPMATGVLLVCVGPATRLIAYVQQLPKQYRARFQLGKRSNTDDITGTLSDVPHTGQPSREQVKAALPRFVGRIEQVPPQFSAVHVEGTRAYSLARRGTKAAIEPRFVEVSRLTLLEYDYPHIELDIECGSGTYVRSIGRDLGEQLGCGAVMSALVRTGVGPFRLDAAIELDRLDASSLSGTLMPPGRAVEHVPRHVCRESDRLEIYCGRPIAAPEGAGFQHDEIVAVFTPDGELACLARFIEPDGALAPKQVFLADEGPSDSPTP